MQLEPEEYRWLMEGLKVAQQKANCPLYGLSTVQSCRKALKTLCFSAFLIITGNSFEAKKEKSRNLSISELSWWR